MTLTSRPLTVMTDIQALDSDDPDIQTPRSGPWWWWLCHPVTMTKPGKKKFVKNLLNLTWLTDYFSNHNDQIPWQWWPWHPDTTFRPLTVMTLTSRHNVQALDRDDPDIQTQWFGLKFCFVKKNIFSVKLTWLTSRYNVQALDSDDSDIQTQRSGPWQRWPWHPDTVFWPEIILCKKIFFC